jgi:mRNA-degrading endonuclease RelE of RelBE toxin-antitoxin system
MSYDIDFTTEGSEALAALERIEQKQVRRKFHRIAHNEFRHPREWDYRQMEGYADGRFCLSDSLRAFADIDETAGVIRIHHVGRRENLYV